MTKVPIMFSWNLCKLYQLIIYSVWNLVIQITIKIFRFTTVIDLFRIPNYLSVATHLLKNGDKQDDTNANNVRQKALLLLCRMQPSQTLFIRNKCIELCKMPSLAVALTLEQPMGSGPINIVSFMTGLLLGKKELLISITV